MTNKNWEEMVQTIGHCFRMDEAEREGLWGSAIARLVAALPHLAGCAHAARTSFANVSLLMTGARLPAQFNQAADESIGERMRVLGNFEGGDQRILERGMLLLELASLGDHAADAEFDKAAKKFNPVADATIDVAAERKRLIGAVEEIECPEMDRIIRAQAAGTKDFWFIKQGVPKHDRSSLSA